jgi:hypothetical protein
LATLVFAAGCQSMQPPPPKTGVVVSVEESPEWQRVATTEDQDKIARLPSAWTAALDEARRAGFTRSLREEGALVDPAAALPRAAPPPGAYNCRLVKLGTQGKGSRAFTAYKPFFCFVGVNDDQLSITKSGGSRRPGGYLFETDKSGRLIFLGSEALGTEEAPIAYGEDPARNMAGVFERYGDFRYRLVVPWPRESKLDIFELIPLPQQP